MKRIACYIILCCGIASLTPSSMAETTNTNSSAAAGSDTPQAAAGTPAPAPVNAAPAAEAGTNATAGANSSPVLPAETNSSPVIPAKTNSSAAALAETNSSPANRTNANSGAESPAEANSSGALAGADEGGPKSEFEVTLELARQQRLQKCYVVAAQILEALLKTNAPPAIQRPALYELAQVMEDEEQPVKAQQIWAQYLHLYADDPTAPDVLLRQGLLYRKMGVNEFAISKFYAVMSSALKLKQDNMGYYKKLVVQAQTEIADTYYLDAKFEEAADFFNRIIKGGDADGNREQLEWKRIRALSYLTNHVETISLAQDFLTRFPKSSNVPEIRFLLAGALKNLGRNADAMQQVLLLLQSQQENVGKDPEEWAYWQKRAGNEIANQLYKQGDYADALAIYLSMAELDPSPDWQAPVWYQAGMAYEQLQQWQKAADIYTRILDSQKNPAPAGDTPALASLREMAQWRKDYIAWMQKARVNDLALHSPQSTNTAKMEPDRN